MITSRLFAHDLAKSESRLEVNGNEIHAVLIVDLLAFSGVDGDGNGRISYEELDRSIASVFAGVKEHFVVRSSGDAARIVMTRHELLDEHTLRMELAYTFPSKLSRLEVTSTLDRLAGRPDHQHFTTVMMSGRRQDAVLNASNHRAVFEHRFWTTTSLALTLAAVAIIGGRIGWFVYQKRRAASRAGTP